MPDSISSIEDKTAVLIVGPTAIGKSTLMNRVVTKHDAFARVRGFTSRPARANDEPGMYRHVTQQEAEQLIASGQALQYALNPANGQVYGTSLEDYPGRYNMKDTLSGAVADFRALPFKQVIVVSLSAPLEDWRRWLDLRYPQAGPDRMKRLLEAKSSIEWSLTQTDDHQWLINRSQALDAVSDELIVKVRRPVYDHSVPKEAYDMLALVDDLLSYG